MYAREEKGIETTLKDYAALIREAEYKIGTDFGDIKTHPIFRTFNVNRIVYIFPLEDTVKQLENGAYVLKYVWDTEALVKLARVEYAVRDVEAHRVEVFIMPKILDQKFRASLCML